MSAQQIWIIPMPAAAPLMAAMTGLGIDSGRVMGQRRSVPDGLPSLAASSSTCMSRPGQNDRPAPVTTMTRTSGSSAAASRVPK